MGKIFCLMGKSSSGKDSIYKALLEDQTLGLKKIVPYTTRPIREGEREGTEYHFVTEKRLEEYLQAGKVVELRAYDTMQGVWKYFTIWEGEDLDKDSYAVIGTLESWHAMCQYFGRERMVPIYIEVEDGQRLLRAVQREQKQKHPMYAELCRRFLADEKDFTEEKLMAEQITTRFHNEDFGFCLREIKLFIQKEMRYN